MSYEEDIELCEYNPVGIKYQNELRKLARIVEAPAQSLFQRLVKQIILSQQVEA